MRLGGHHFWITISLLVFTAGGASAVYSYVNTPDLMRHPPHFPTPNIEPTVDHEFPDPPIIVSDKPVQPVKEGVRQPGARRVRHYATGEQPYNNESDPGLAKFYGSVYSTGSSDAPSPMPLRPTTHTNVLVLGIDDGYGGLGRSDTIMVVSLGEGGNPVNLLSLPRDTLVYIPGHGYDKVNAAHAYGGPSKSMETIQGILGVPLHHYVSVDFAGAQKVLDVLGGVDFDVDKNMHYIDHTAHLNIQLKKGFQHLNGVQAASYLRFRHDNYGDIGRVYRQQRMIKAIMDKLKAPSTLLRLPQLIATGLQYVHTDMSTLAISNLAYGAIRGIQGRGSLPTTMVPGYVTSRRASYWIMDKPRTERLVQDLLIGNGVAADNAPLAAPSGLAPLAGASGSPGAATVTPPRNYRPSISVIVTRPDMRPYKSLLAALEKAGYRVVGVHTDYTGEHPYTHVDSHQGTDIPEDSQDLVQAQLLSVVGTERINIVERTRQETDFTVICGEDFPGLKLQSSPSAEKQVSRRGSRPTAPPWATLPPAERPVVVTPENGIIIQDAEPSDAPSP